MSDVDRKQEDRAWLGFAPAVEDAFSFLLELGFHIAESAPTIVRYEKDGLFVIVYHGRHSWEIGFEIGRQDETFSMYRMLASASAEEADEYRNPTAGNPTAVDSSVKKIAELVRRYGRDALEADPVFFARMRQQRQDWAKAFELQVRADQNRPRAEAAFREGRYREAAELYEEMAAALTPVEKKKLALARRRSQDS
jgi:hypothetical protein